MLQSILVYTSLTDPIVPRRLSNKTDFTYKLKQNLPAMQPSKSIRRDILKLTKSVYTQH